MLDATRALPRRDARAAGGLRRHHRPVGAPPAARRRRPGPGGCSASRPATRARSPAQLRTLVGPRRRACCSPSRPRRTCTPGPATRSRSAARGCRPRTCASTGSSTCPRPTRCSRRSARPPGAQPQAPPDNVVLLPAAHLPHGRGAAGRKRADLVRTQVHVAPAPRPPGQPERGVHARSAGDARNLETRLAGAGLVGDNLGAALDKARRTRSTPQLLFLFLGLPGAILAGLLTATIAAAGAERRRARRGAAAHARSVDAPARAAGARRDGARRRGRGRARAGHRAADRRHRVRHAPASAPARCRRVLWAGGVGAGRPRSSPAPRSPCPHGATRARSPSPAHRAPAAARARAVVGALRPRRRLPGRRRRSCTGRPRRNGYQLVLAPEGVPQVSVNWYALLAPVLGWIGAGLLAYRLADLVLRRGRRPLTRALRPVAGELASTVAATMSRQRAAAGPRRRAGRADRRLRRLDRGVQLHLPAAGRGRRAADQRRRRHRHRVDPATRGAGAAAQRLRARRRRRLGRAAAAPLRLRRRRPPGPLRRAARDDRRRGQAPGRVVRRRQRRRAHAPSRRPSRRGPGQRRDRAATSSSRPATCCACACRTARTKPLHHRAVPLRGRGARSSRPRRWTVLRRQRGLRRARPPAATRSAPSSSQTDGTSPAAVAQPRAARRRARRPRSPTSRPSARSSAPT